MGILCQLHSFSHTIIVILELERIIELPRTILRISPCNRNVRYGITEYSIPVSSASDTFLGLYSDSLSRNSCIVLEQNAAKTPKGCPCSFTEGCTAFRRKQFSIHLFDAFHNSIPCLPATINALYWRTARVAGIRCTRNHVKNVIISSSITGYMGDHCLLIFADTPATASAMMFSRFSGILPTCLREILYFSDMNRWRQPSGRACFFVLCRDWLLMTSIFRISLSRISLLWVSYRVRKFYTNSWCCTLSRLSNLLLRVLGQSKW